MNLNEQSKKAFAPDLMELPNVHGVAPGKKIIGDGTVTDIDCVTVFVTKKVSAFRLNEEEKVPFLVGGVPTDVVELAQMEAIRPIPASTRWVQRRVGGTSIGHVDITAGTAGILVVDKVNGRLGILSNAHVLANVNRGLPGDGIWWPGPYDGPGQQVARLTRSQHIYMVDEAEPSPEPPPSGCSPLTAAMRFLLPLVGPESTRLIGTRKPTPDEIGRGLELEPLARQLLRGNSSSVLNRVDCAFAELLPGVAFESGIATIGFVSGSTDALAGMVVRKYGRTTDYTSGTVLYTDVMIDVSYGSHGVARFDGQLMISPSSFSQGGDSGSLIVTTIGTTNYAVALLFAGNDTATIANPIQEVIDTLGVTWQMTQANT